MQSSLLLGAPGSRGCRWPVTFWAGFLTVFGPAAANGDELGELWRMKVEAGVEWAERVDSDGRTWIIVCSRGAHVYTVDAGSGVVSQEPVAAGRGVRFAGAQGGLAYLFDRYALYALGLDESPGRLRWRCGEWPAGGDVGDDPEFLTPLISARACSGGVVAVRSDGRLALVHEQTGTPRWQRQMGPVNHCRLLVGPSAGVILHRAGARTVGVVLRPLVEPLPVATVEPGGGWPIWGAVDGRELVVADLGSVRRVPLDGGSVRTIEVPRGERLLATAIDSEPGDGRPGQGMDCPGLAAIWAGSDGGAVYRFDLASGVVDTVVERPVRSAEGWTALRVGRRAVLAHSDNQLLVLGISSRRMIAQYTSGEQEVIRAVGIVDETVYAVVAPLAVGEQGAATHLIFFPLSAADPPASAVDSEPPPPASGVAVRRRHLPGGAGVRQWLWVGSRLVAVGPESLTAYALPASAARGD